jgi:hypothetical protein
VIALQLLVYSIAAVGLAYVVGHSAVSLPFRAWLAPAAVAVCPTCGDVQPPRFEGAICIGPTGGPVHADATMRIRQPRGLRYWIVTLIECPACLGFWIGLVAGAFYGRSVLLAVAGAFYTAGSNFWIARATGLMPNPSQEIPPGD